MYWLQSVTLKHRDSNTIGCEELQVVPNHILSGLPSLNKSEQHA